VGGWYARLIARVAVRFRRKGLDREQFGRSHRGRHRFSSGATTEAGGLIINMIEPGYDGAKAQPHHRCVGARKSHVRLGALGGSIHGPLLDPAVARR
jgi:hypothetical protein